MEGHRVTRRSRRPSGILAAAMDFPLKVAADLRPYSPEVMGPAGPAFSTWLAESLGLTQDRLS